MREDSTASNPRERILNRLRASIQRRAGSAAGQDERAEHPGLFEGGRPGHEIAPHAGPSALDLFRTMFQSAGGEVVELEDEAAARDWIIDLDDFASVCLGTEAPDLLPSLPKVEPHEADVGISRARAAIGETGSVVLDSRDGRRAQLLAPTHVVIVDSRRVYPAMADALAAVESDLPSALGLHSGPSKSADIGQVMVRGVHGPGRVVAVVLGG